MEIQIEISVINFINFQSNFHEKPTKSPKNHENFINTIQKIMIFAVQIPNNVLCGENRGNMFHIQSRFISRCMFLCRARGNCDKSVLTITCFLNFLCVLFDAVLQFVKLIFF
jgi:hypothetical protein